MDLFLSSGFGPRAESLMAKNHIVGLSMAIIQNDTIEARAFGMASLDPPKNCTVDTLFDIASSSKSFTAASVGMIVHDSVKYPDIEWDTPLYAIMPEDFVMSEEWYTKGVTIDDMLSHRTGLPRHDMSYFGPNAKKPDTAKSVTRNLRNLDVAGPIRMEYRYCNIMYTVASYLIESLTKNTFTHFLETAIFGPLDMNSTSLQPSSARKKGLADRFAVGYEWDGDAEKYNSVEMPEGPESQGAGFIVTSANDFIKWVAALMNQKGPISPELYKSLVRQRTIVAPDGHELLPLTSPEIYSAGLSTVYYRGHAIVAHDGNDAGYGSYHFWLPSFKFGGVVLGNSGSTYGTASILVNELIDEVLKIPKDQRVDWEKVITERNEKGDGPEEDPIAEIRKEFNPDLKENQPQTRPLKDYVGVYYNKGYGDVTFQIKDGHLFVDATDRAYNFYLNLTHICDQTKYAAHLIGSKATGNEDGGYIKAEFEFKNGKAAQVGLDFEQDLDENILFTRK